MEDVNYLDWTSLVLVIIGALNWGLMGLSGFANGDPNNWNIVALLLGSVPTAEWAVYALVGIAGLYQVYFGYEMTQ